MSEIGKPSRMMTPAELVEIERRLAGLPLSQRKALAQRLVLNYRPIPRSEELASRLLSCLRQLRPQTDILPSNRELERLAGLEGEDISYLLKMLRKRGSVLVDYPWSGVGHRTFDLP